jgi:hypothetical protein
MKRCPYCTEEVEDYHRFCRCCGRELPGVKKPVRECPYCLEEIEADATVCVHCWREIEPEVPEKQASTLKRSLEAAIAATVFSLFLHPSMFLNKLYEIIAEIAIVFASSWAIAALTIRTLSMRAKRKIRQG